jgi:hypothetical protein
MKIENLRSESIGERARISATVVWEDCDRPAEDLFIETDEQFADGLTCNPHAFLVGCTVPAMYYGEARIAIDADICPELLSGLNVAMTLLRYWFYEPGRKLVTIEGGRQADTPKPEIPRRTGIFFSGGVDAFATLRLNRLNFPLEHPGLVRDGLLVYGLDLDSPEAFEHVLRMESDAAREIGITLIPVYTNIYLAYRKEDAKNHFRFWINQFQSSAFAAIAHAFSRRLTSMIISASDSTPHIIPGGCHPLLDPNYSSSDMRIYHQGIDLSRLEKTRLVSEWDVALQYLRVCNMFTRYQADHINCGECEKCIRTMLALLALGALDRSPTFPSKDVTPELILQRVAIDDPMIMSSYRELLLPLSAIGRTDLEKAIRKVVARPGTGRETSIATKPDHKYFGDYFRKILKAAGF